MQIKNYGDAIPRANITLSIKYLAAVKGQSSQIEYSKDVTMPGQKLTFQFDDIPANGESLPFLIQNASEFFYRTKNTRKNKYTAHWIRADIRKDY